MSLAFYYCLSVLVVCGRALAKLDITSAHIISLRTPAARLYNETTAWLAAIHHPAAAVFVHRAQTNYSGRVPIGTRIAMLQGRHSHAEIGSAAALGCLASHAAVWRGMREGDTVAVFEEDARLDASSARRMLAVERDLPHHDDWDLIVLETGHLTTSGAWRRMGAVATCAATAACEWQGSRGYILRYSGARELLIEDAPHVQVDALFWMLAAVGRLRMYWTTADIAHPTYAAPSTVWDGCLKCYIPPSQTGLLLFLAFIGLIAAAHAAQTQTGTLLRKARQCIARLRR